MRCRKSYNTKEWYRNINKQIIDVEYRHKGEANNLYLLDLVSSKFKIPSLDRIASESKIWKGR